MREEDNSEMSKDDALKSSTSEQEIPDLQKPQKTPKIPAWLPDWKKTEGYPDPQNKVSEEQWAWEFIRRNPKYQYLYRIGRRYKESWYKAFPNSVKFSRYFKCVPKVNKGESYSQYMARCELENIAPQITPKRPRILKVFPVIEFSTKLDPAKKKPPQFNKDYGYPICDTVSEDESEITYSIDRVDEVFMVFSAALPIKDQIERAERLLFQQQKYYEEQGNKLPHKGRVQTSPLRNYLRYLDGKISGASPSEIARVVHPNIDVHSARQRYDKGRKTAEYFRDVGYLKILNTGILK